MDTARRRRLDELAYHAAQMLRGPYIPNLPEQSPRPGPPPLPPPRPRLVPIEVVIYDAVRGWVTLATHPGVDLTKPIDLVVDDGWHGLVRIGRILPLDQVAPGATTIPVTLHTEPLAGMRPGEKTKAGWFGADIGGSAEDFARRAAGATPQPPRRLLDDVVAEYHANLEARRAGNDQGSDGEVENAEATSGSDGKSENVEATSGSDGEAENTAATSDGGGAEFASEASAAAGDDAYDLAIKGRRQEAVAAVKAGQRIPGTEPETERRKDREGSAPPPIDPASLPAGPLNKADYERVRARAIYLTSLYHPESLSDRALNLLTGAMNDPARVVTPAEQAEHKALIAKLNERATPTPQEARLDAMLNNSIGAAASVIVGAVGGNQLSQDVALGVGGLVDAGGVARGLAPGRPRIPGVIRPPLTEERRPLNEEKREDGRPPNTRPAEPGAWQTVNEAMSPRAAAYQKQITGRTEQSYVVNGVKFDGYDGSSLLEAKGPGYASFVRNGEFTDFFRGGGKLVNQAMHQTEAANGLPITWYVAEAETAEALRRLLADKQIKGITVVYSPVIP